MAATAIPCTLTPGYCKALPVGFFLTIGGHNHRHIILIRQRHTDSSGELSGEHYGELGLRLFRLIIVLDDFQKRF
jgi:hypothetical protein